MVILRVAIAVIAGTIFVSAVTVLLADLRDEKKRNDKARDS